MKNSYLNLVTKQGLIESTEDQQVAKHDIKKQLMTFGASLDSSENIYEAFRSFIEDSINDLGIKTELLDTVAFCEADEADLESTLIKLKIAVDNNLINETVNQNTRPRFISWNYKPVINDPPEGISSLTLIKDLPDDYKEHIIDVITNFYYNELKYPKENFEQLLDYMKTKRNIQSIYRYKDMRYVIDYFMKKKLGVTRPSMKLEPAPKPEKKPKKTPQLLTPDSLDTKLRVFKNSIQKHIYSADTEYGLLKLQDRFFNSIDNFTKDEISKYELEFETLWDALDEKRVSDKLESIKMIDKDFLITESDINRSVKENSYNPRAELDPVRCFVILDKNDKPMLNKGGIVITNTPDAEEQIQARADDLYRLIHNAKSIYIIEDEAYDKCVDIRDQKEYVKFIKDNGTLVKPSKDLFTFESSDIEDPDFLLDIEEMFE